MSKIEVGDLVFLPSDVTLLRISDERSSFCRTKMPRHVLVLENEEDCLYYTVLYDGSRWSAYKKDVYPIVEKEVINNDC